MCENPESHIHVDSFSTTNLSASGTIIKNFKRWVKKIVRSKFWKITCDHRQNVCTPFFCFYFNITKCFLHHLTPRAGWSNLHNLNRVRKRTFFFSNLLCYIEGFNIILYFPEGWVKIFYSLLFRININHLKASQMSQNLKLAKIFFCLWEEVILFLITIIIL